MLVRDPVQCRDDGFVSGALTDEDTCEAQGLAAAATRSDGTSTATLALREEANHMFATTPQCGRAAADNDVDGFRRIQRASRGDPPVQAPLDCRDTSVLQPSFKDATTSFARRDHHALRGISRKGAMIPSEEDRFGVRASMP